MPVAQGWIQSTRDGNVNLSPPGLAQGVACTLTLLGGEPFTGSLKDQLTSEWKDFEALGTVVTDDGVKMTGEGGPVVWQAARPRFGPRMASQCMCGSCW